MMINVIQSIFGAYEPLPGEGLASINIEYCSEVLLFSICLYGLLRIIGAVIKNV